MIYTYIDISHYDHHTPPFMVSQIYLKDIPMAIASTTTSSAQRRLRFARTMSQLPVEVQGLSRGLPRVAHGAFGM
jgi:hypothetical protein